MARATEVLDRIESTCEWQQTLDKNLHAHPELSSHEVEAAADIAGRLDGCPGFPAVDQELSGTEKAGGTFVARFQPAEETAAGFRAMVEEGLTVKIPRPDVAFGQHVLSHRAYLGEEDAS